ncbi:MAG: Nramp family divalent metal transporter [Chloroflexales bacterium]|nr:Nramp family divalent metal transporter [Chloroflexales bacterium]
MHQENVDTNSIPTGNNGWREARHEYSLPEVFSSIKIPTDAGFWRTLLAFAGPGLMVAVGYMDPGNWATDIAGGAQFGYLLLSVILISNFMAILLQHLALKLGVVTGRDLAQACRDHYSRPVSFILWILCQIAIVACDIAEVIGAAIALNLLFGVPIVYGVIITALDVLMVLFLQSKGFRYIESIVGGLVFVIFICFMYEMAVSSPSIAAILVGLIPSPQIVYNPDALYIAIGILGATVMPHNLYLHSSIVQTRNFARDDIGKAMAIKFATIDSTVFLLFALVINAAILILAAATFYGTAHAGVTDIADAYNLLTPLLGASFASIAFGVALLASGQSSTLTGTLAGQIIMEGFLKIRLPSWMIRVITRGLAIIPAIIVAIVYGERGTGELLVFSQVILALQLGFAVVPLVTFTSDKTKMGKFVNPLWLTVLAWGITAVIISLNAYLVLQIVIG